MGYIGVIFGSYSGYMGIPEKKMETSIIGYVGVIFGSHRGYTGIMEKNLETTLF